MSRGRAALVVTLSATLACVVRAQGALPPRGRALFDLLGREPLVGGNGDRPLRWLPDGSGWYIVDSTAGSPFQRVDPRTGQRTPLFDEKTLTNLREAYLRLGGRSTAAFPFQDLAYSSGGRAMVLKTDDGSFLFDIPAGTLERVPVTRPAPPDQVEELMPGVDTSQLVRGSYSPHMGRVAYVRGYDLYMSGATGPEVQITTGGSEELMNGRPDWMYFEELGQRDGFYWSPDGQKIAFLQWDEHLVERYPILHDLAAPPRVELQRYPPPGGHTPAVRLFVIDLRSGKLREMDTRSSAASADAYILKPMWLPDGSALSFQRLSRRHNVLELLLADPETGTSHAVLREEEPEFVSLHDDLRFLARGRRFLWTSARSGWRHLYVYDESGKLLHQLTSGEWPVQRIVTVDERNGWVYFMAAQNDGWDSQLFKVRLDGSHLAQLTTEPGVHHVALDPTATFFSDSWSSLRVAPRTDLRLTADGRLVRTLAATNTARQDSLALEPPESLSVRAADDTTPLHGLLFRPAGFDPARRYPLVVSVSGDPRAQRVTNSYQFATPEERLAQLGFAVWTMDSRGTPNRGQRFETATYLHLGEVDLQDQASAVRQLARTEAFVDASRVGIYGSAYGGYLAVLSTMKIPDLFRVAVAQSSISDWRNIDAAFSERYMRTPEENPEGYTAGSILSYVANLRGRLLIAYGTTDDEVHESNSLQLIDALERAGKQFDVMVYPERRHAVTAADAPHLAEQRAEFFVRHLHPETAERTASQPD